MSKKRKITPAMIRTATGRTPSQPERPNPQLQQLNDALKTFRDRYPDLYSKFWEDVCASSEMTGVKKGVFRCNNPQLQQIPRSDLVNMDYATIEQRVASMSPAFAAPYGQPEKDNADE